MRAILRIMNLPLGSSPEDLFVLLANIRRVFSAQDGPDLPDEALTAFMAHCSERIGEAYFRTPRNSVKAFVSLMSVLEQNPETDWRELIGEAEIAPEGGDDLSDIDEAAGAAAPADQPAEAGKDDDLASFRL